MPFLNKNIQPAEENWTEGEVKASLRIDGRSDLIKWGFTCEGFGYVVEDIPAVVEEFDKETIEENIFYFAIIPKYDYVCVLRVNRDIDKTSSTDDMLYNRIKSEVTNPLNFRKILRQYAPSLQEQANKASGSTSKNRSRN